MTLKYVFSDSARSLRLARFKVRLRLSNEVALRDQSSRSIDFLVELLQRELLQRLLADVGDVRRNGLIHGHVELRRCFRLASIGALLKLGLESDFVCNENASRRVFIDVSWDGRILHR
jgi:hypothetical protein